MNKLLRKREPIYSVICACIAVTVSNVWTELSALIFLLKVDNEGALLTFNKVMVHLENLCPGLNTTAIFTIFCFATNFTKIAIYGNSHE